MKNQYFGDINDYRKYGLIRSIYRASGMSAGFCWMLTSDDGSTDGEKRQYLTEPEKWRHHDPELFDLLAAVDQPHQQSVTLIQDSSLFPGSVFHSDLLSERAVNRDQYFEGALVRLKSNPLIFFDPDNGMEVDSVGRNSRGADRYLYWEEAAKFYDAGHSILIYQHFRRIKRAVQVPALMTDMLSRLDAKRVDVFATANTAFVYIPQPSPWEERQRLLNETENRWRGEFKYSSLEI